MGVRDSIDPEFRERMRIDRSIWKEYDRKRYIVYIVAPAIERKPSKIGIARDPKRRLGALQVSHWVRLKIFHCGYCIDEFAARRIEMEAHKLLDEYRLLGEWFNVEPKMAIEAAEFAALALRIDFQRADDARLDKAQKR